MRQQAHFDEFPKYCFVLGPSPTIPSPLPLSNIYETFNHGYPEGLLFQWFLIIVGAPLMLYA
jgi:hypothetical protein